MAQGLPTVLQFANKEVWFFDKNGVQCLDPDMDWLDIQGISEDDFYCALVDSNDNLEQTAMFIQHPGSPFCIIYASSPREYRWHWSKYHGITQYFYTKPFSVEEVLMGMSVFIFLEFGV